MNVMNLGGGIQPREENSRKKREKRKK